MRAQIHPEYGVAMRYAESEETRDGRSIPYITIEFSSEEQQTMLNFLGMEREVMRKVFERDRVLELFSKDIGDRRITVRALPDYAHIVSDGHVYIGIWIDDLSGVAEYTNAYWLGYDDCRKWETDRDTVISCTAAVYIMPKDRRGQEGPDLYGLRLMKERN